MNPMDMLNHLQQAEATLNSFKAEGEAGAGMVKITLNGQYVVSDVKIAKEVINPEDPELLQDLIVAAYTDASAKVKAKLNEQLLSFGNMNMYSNNDG